MWRRLGGTRGWLVMPLIPFLYPDRLHGEEDRCWTVAKRTADSAGVLAEVARAETEGGRDTASDVVDRALNMQADGARNRNRLARAPPPIRSGTLSSALVAGPRNLVMWTTWPAVAGVRGYSVA